MQELAPRRPRVLVVDDAAEMAEILVWDLVHHGYEGVAATSGHEALRLLRKGRFDAVVTDLCMPELDGLAVLRHSYDLDPSRPVVMMTAHGSINTALEAAEEGAFQYLTKPFRIDALLRVLDRALRASLGPPGWARRRAAKLS